MSKEYVVKRAHWHNRTARPLRVGDPLPPEPDEFRIRELLANDLIAEKQAPPVENKDAGPAPRNKDKGSSQKTKDADA